MSARALDCAGIALQVLYEARGPGGAGFIAAALTDNLNRSVAFPWRHGC